LLLFILAMFNRNLLNGYHVQTHTQLVKTYIHIFVFLDEGLATSTSRSCLCSSCYNLLLLLLLLLLHINNTFVCLQILLPISFCVLCVSLSLQWTISNPGAALLLLIHTGNYGCIVVVGCRMSVVVDVVAQLTPLSACQLHDKLPSALFSDCLSVCLSIRLSICLPVCLRHSLYVWLTCRQYWGKLTCPLHNLTNYTDKNTKRYFYL